MASYLVTGSSRGIGLDLVTYLLSLPTSRVKVVFATARDSKNNASLVSLANSPEGLGRIVLVTLDVHDGNSVDNATVTVQRILGMRNGLDVLINNTNFLLENRSMTEGTEDDVTRNLQTVVRAFLPIMRRGAQKKVIHLGVTSGFTGHSARAAQKDTIQAPPDHIGETGFSIVNTQWAMTLKDEGFTVAAILSDSTSRDIERNVPLASNISCKAIVDKIDSLGQGSSKVFINTVVPGMENTESIRLENP